MDNARGFCCTDAFNRSLVEVKCDDTPGETLGFDSDQLADLFQRIVLTTCPRCERNSETVLHVIVQCPKITDMCIYFEQLLSHREKLQLFSESIIKIFPPSSYGKEREAFLAVVAAVK